METQGQKTMEMESMCSREDAVQEIKNTAKDGIITYVGEKLEKYLSEWGNTEVPPTDQLDCLLLDIAAGDLERTQQAVAQGVSVNASWEGGFTPLICASYFGHLPIVKFLLAVGREPRSTGTTKEGQNAIKGTKVYNTEPVVIPSSQSRNAHEIETVILDACTQRGSTALIIACQRGHINIVNLLLDARGVGSVAQPCNGELETGLFAACCSGSSDIARLLLDVGCQVNVPKILGRTPLMQACMRGYHELASMLLDSGAKINMTEDEGHSALSLACLNGKYDVAKLLISHGSKVNATDLHGWTSLMCASQNGHTNIANLLILNGAKLELTTGKGRTALMMASSFGHKDTINLLLKSGSPVNCSDEEGYTALSLACQQGYYGVVQLLLKADADVSVSGKKSRSPITCASHGGHNTIVTLLLENGIHVDTPNYDGWTALMFAALGGHCSTVELLIEAGADVNKTNINCVPATWIASHSGQNEVIKLLLEKGARLDVPMHSGHNALSQACMGGHLDTVKMLLDYDNFLSLELQEAFHSQPASVGPCNTGSDCGFDELLESSTPDCVSSEAADSAAMLCEPSEGVLQNSSSEDSEPMPIAMRVSYVYLAAKCGHRDIVQYLLEKGAAVDIPDLQGRTALLRTCQMGYSDIVRSLLQYNADVNLQDHTGATSLIMASAKGYDEIVRQLLQHGAKVDVAETKHGTTPLLHAAQNGHLDTVRSIIEHGAMVNITDHRNTTGLIEASRQGHANIVTLLLEKGANVNAAMTNGRTALIQASQNGHFEIAKMLINAGAQVNAADKSGLTALIIGSEKGQTEVVKMLLLHGAHVDTEARIPDTAHSYRMILTEETTKHLVGSGGDFNSFSITENEGEPVLVVESEDGTSIGCDVLFETKSGMTKNVPLFDNRTALMQACQGGHMDIIKLLLAAGAKVNIAGSRGHTSLLSASEAGHSDIVKLLLDHGAKVDTPLHSGRSSLILASQNGHWETVKLLVKYGANIRMTDDYGMSALLCCCDGRHWSVAELLLDAGADVLQTNALGENALMYLVMADITGRLQLQLDCHLPYPLDKENRLKLTQQSDYGISAPSTLLLGALLENSQINPKFHSLVLDLFDSWGLNTCLYGFLPGFCQVAKPIDAGFPAHCSMEYKVGLHTVGTGLLVTLPVRVLEKLPLDTVSKHSLVNMLGQTPLHLLAFETYHEENELKEAIQLMMKLGFRFSDTDSNGRLPIHVACICLNARFIQCASLLDKSLSVHLRTKDHINCEPEQYLPFNEDNICISIIRKLLVTEKDRSDNLLSETLLESQPLGDARPDEVSSVSELLGSTMTAAELSVVARKMKSMTFSEHTVQQLFQDRTNGVVRLDTKSCQQDILHVVDLLHVIGKEMGQINPVFKCEPDMKGSVQEYTRCGQLDEMDTSMKLVNFTEYFDIDIAKTHTPNESAKTQLTQKSNDDLYWKPQIDVFAFVEFSSDFWLLFLEALKAESVRSFLCSNSVVIENVNRKHGFVGTMNVSVGNGSKEPIHPISVDIAPCIEENKFDGFAALLGPRYYKDIQVGEMDVELSSFKKDWTLLKHCPHEVLNGYTLIKLLLTLTKSFKASNGVVYPCEYILPSYMVKTTLLWILDPSGKCEETYMEVDTDSINAKETVTQYRTDALQLCEDLIKHATMDCEYEECMPTGALEKLKLIRTKCTDGHWSLNYGETIEPYIFKTISNAMHGNMQNGIDLTEMRESLCRQSPHSSENSTSSDSKGGINPKLASGVEDSASSDDSAETSHGDHASDDDDDGYHYPDITLDMARRCRIWALRMLRLLPLLLADKRGLQNYYLIEQEINTRDRTLTIELCRALEALLQ